MTETEILKQIQSDFKGVQDDSKKVTTSVNTLTNEITGLKVAVVNIEKTLDNHDKRITETREAGLLATQGVKVVDRDIKQIKITVKDDRAHVDSEFKDLREDQTGQTDVPPQAIAAAVVPKTNGAMVMGALKTFGPWMVAAAIFIGAYLGSGGDKEKALQVLQNQMLQEIGLRVERIEKNKTEPVRVPVPVTASDLYSEEIAP